MREAVLQFRWSRPRGGVEIVQGWTYEEVGKVNRNEFKPPEAPTKSYLVSKDPEAGFIEEDYFDYGVNFRRELLGTPPNDEPAIRRCAEFFGFLTGPVPFPVSEAEPSAWDVGPGLKAIVLQSGEMRWGEGLAEWRECIGLHRLVYAMHNGLLEGDAGALHREKRELGIDLKDVNTEYLWKWGEGDKPIRPVMGDWNNLFRFLNARLQNAVLRVTRDIDGSCALVQSASDLEAFSWLLFAQDLTKGRVPLRCQCCENRFLPHPRAKPGFSRFCRDSCRVTQSRRRKKAKGLLEEGNSPRQIAHRLGLKPSQVRQLIGGG